MVRAPYNTNASILVIAGGGGGVAGAVNDVATRHGTTATAGQDGDQTQYAHTPGYGGIDGNGGTQGDAHSGNGGGFFTNGEDGQAGGGGASFLSGGAAGTHASYSNGGFGGGGAAGNAGGGGGGGYSGGGGSYHYPTAGGGAGSYNNGTDQDNASAANAGAGQVVITALALSYSVGGTVTGLTGDGLVLQNNGGDDLAVAALAADFTFNTELADAADYAVSVSVQPVGQSCSVIDGSGTIAAANVTDVAVRCVDDPADAAPVADSVEPPKPVPAMPLVGLGVMVLGLLGIARRRLVRR